jgi:hypothetical protein
MGLSPIGGVPGRSSFRPSSSKINATRLKSQHQILGGVSDLKGRRRRSLTPCGCSSIVLHTILESCSQGIFRVSRLIIRHPPSTRLDHVFDLVTHYQQHKDFKLSLIYSPTVCSSSIRTLDKLRRSSTTWRWFW